MQEKLLKDFDYKDGYLYRRDTGARIGYIDSHSGYVRIAYDKRNLLAHRLIWTYHHGEIKKGLNVDHIDGDKTNNKIENLRLCNQMQNLGNAKISETNKTGFRGVSYHSPNGKYRAKLQNRGLGYFDTPEEASEIYEKEARVLFGEFFRG